MYSVLTLMSAINKIAINYIKQSKIYNFCYPNICFSLYIIIDNYFPLYQ